MFAGFFVCLSFLQFLYLFFCARTFLFCILSVCARVSVLVFVFVGVILGGCPARRVNPGDATPIVQSRPARKGDKQTQTHKRTTITQKRNPVTLRELPRPSLPTGGQRTTFSP